MPLQKTIGLTSEYLCMQENQSGPIKSVEFSPASCNSATDTDLCKEVPVPQTDRDGNADLPQVSATPTKSVSNSPSIFISPDVSWSPVPDQISQQSTETKSSSNMCAENHSDQLFQSIPTVSNECQSFESNSPVSSYCDSGIASMYSQTFQHPTPTITHSSLPERDSINQNQNLSLIISKSDLFQVKSREEDSKETVNLDLPTQTLHQSEVVEVTNNRGRDLSPLPKSTPILSLDNVITSLTDTSLSGCTNQPVDPFVKSFEQVKQSDGHKEYGRLHPVRRPWKVMYYTLRWLKPFT